MAEFTCKSPIDGSPVFTGKLAEADDISRALESGAKAQPAWAAMPLEQRKTVLEKAVQYLQDHQQEIGAEITHQMGRPIQYSPGEINGVVERASAMLALADSALADITPAPRAGFERYIKRCPLGIVAVLAPWNYPYLTSVNVIIPALAAGNCVILKHSNQTPLVAQRWQAAFDHAGVPAGVFQHLYLDHAGTADLIAREEIGYVAFTGSVAGGQAVVKAMAEAPSTGFPAIGLELGGKDPAYVRADADPDQAAIALADGAFFNSGQSCCGIERIYVAENLFDRFLERFIAEAKALKLGDPLKPETSLGPMVNAKAADYVRQQIADACAKGAIAHLPIDENWESAYLAPQVLTNVTHNMEVMSEESFGPVIGIMAVSDDDQAIALMNDSAFGLTASIWTQDPSCAANIGTQLETGTVFMNRCDYLDPELAWVGVKNSGRGCTLSQLGYEALTRPKSFHLKMA